LPDWLLKDIEIASEVHFPINAYTYALNWNQLYSYGTDIFDSTKHIWIAGYTGIKKVSNYYNYTGSFSMKAMCQAIPQSITSVYFLESDKGVGVLVPAVSINYGADESLAFADNQVIIKNDHAGVDQYTVYPVKGIKIKSILK
jgi:hypothetical protein